MANQGIVCENCGLDVVVPVSGPAGMIVSVESKGFSCPRCGSPIADQAGTFMVIESLFERIGSNLSKTELEALTRALEAARQAGSTAAAKAIMEEQAPSIAPFMTSWWGLDQRQLVEFFQFALVALGFVIGFAHSGSVADGFKALGSSMAAIMKLFKERESQVDVQDEVSRGVTEGVAAYERKRRERNQSKRQRRARRRSGPPTK